MTKIAITLAALALPVPAMAQDGDAPFSGPYVAALVGYDKLRIDTSVGTGSDDGVLFGGVVGYDLNVRGLVIGAEGEFSDSNVRERGEDLFVAGDSLTLKTGRDLYAGVRMGGEVSPGFMLYAKGGYTNAKLKAVYVDGTGTQSGRVRLDGYRLGAGVETNVAGFLGRVEYRYSSYNSFEDTISANPDRHQLALLVGYRF